MHDDLSLLARKAAAGRPPVDPDVITPERALRQACARAGQEALGLVVGVTAVTERRITTEELLETLEDRALLAVLDGPGEGLGLLAISAPVLAAFLEMQMIGRVAPVEPSPRRPTRADAAIATGFVDALLEGFERALAGTPHAVWAGGFRYGSFLEEARPLGLLLEEPAYRVFDAELDLAEGVRRGRVTLALPATGRGAMPLARPMTPMSNAATESWATRLEATVMETEAEVEAVLARLTLPLSALLGLKPGMLIPVERQALEALTLEGADGRKLAAARLGQTRGHRAVRLTGSELPGTTLPDQEMSAPTLGTGTGVQAL